MRRKSALQDKNNQDLIVRTKRDRNSLQSYDIYSEDSRHEIPYNTYPTFEYPVPLSQMMGARTDMVNMMLRVFGER